MSDQEIELDFTNVDRISEHLDGGMLPVWFETTKPIEELYARESLEKALALVRNNRVTESGREGLYEVTGSEMYLNNVIELGEDQVPGVTCNCPNGSNRSGRPTCYHSAASLLVHLKVDLDEFELKVVEMPETVKKKRPRK